jgi:hypothetical protein
MKYDDMTGEEAIDKVLIKLGDGQELANDLIKYFHANNISPNKGYLAAMLIARQFEQDEPEKYRMIKGFVDTWEQFHNPKAAK